MSDFDKITNLMEIREQALKLSKNINSLHDKIRTNLTDDDSFILDIADNIINLCQKK